MTITADAAVAQLVDEGYRRDDVTAAIDSLIESGLSTDSDDTNLTDDELDVVREQLGATPKRTGRPALDPNSPTKAVPVRLPSSMLDQLDQRAERLDVNRSELIRRYVAAGLAAESADEIRSWRARCPGSVGVTISGATLDQAISSDVPALMTAAGIYNYRIIRMGARFITRGVPGKGSVELRITWVANTGIPSKDDGAKKVLTVEIEAKKQDLPEPATWAA